MGFYNPIDKFISINVPRAQSRFSGGNVFSDMIQRNWKHENVHLNDHVAQGIKQLILLAEDEQADIFRSPNVLENKLHLMHANPKYFAKLPVDDYMSYASKNAPESLLPEMNREGEFNKVYLGDLGKEISDIIGNENLQNYKTLSIFKREIISHMVPNVFQEWKRGSSYDPTSPKSVQREVSRKLLRNLLKDTLQTYWPTLEDRENYQDAYDAFNDKIHSLRKENFYDLMPKEQYLQYRRDKKKQAFIRLDDLNPFTISKSESNPFFEIFKKNKNIINNLNANNLNAKFHDNTLNWNKAILPKNTKNNTGIDYFTHKNNAWDDDEFDPKKFGYE